MSSVEYLIIFESIIYGIVVTQIIIGLGIMLQQRGTYKVYWAHVLFILTYFITAVQNFYASQGLEQYELVFNSFSFLIFIIVGPTVISVIIFLLIPKELEGVDFRELVMKEIGPICIALLIYVISIVYGNIVKDSLGLIGWLPHLILSILYITVWITKKHWMFETLIVLQLINSCYFLWIR